MIWNLTCRKARRSLALRAGNDLDETSRVETERHLATCPHCRAEWQRLRAGQQALDLARTAAIDSVRPELGGAPGALNLSASRELCSSRERGGSVWPAVSRQIRAIEQSFEVRVATSMARVSAPISVGWRSWLPMGTLAAACLAFVLAVVPQPEQYGRLGATKLSNPYAFGAGLSVPIDFPGNDESVNWTLPPGWRDGPRVRTLIDGTSVSELTRVVPKE
ncbi:MAG: zf-HC2 domain-containing protein [Planctomycetaceae bacterium]|nr:zf-HC2 domain-containing protein [Planctomycetaceae bacterium]